MFDPLLENDPWVLEKVAEGIAEGEARGELKALRSMLREVVRQRFPRLEDLAERIAREIEQPVPLNVLLVQLIAAQDEQTARSLLEHHPHA